MTSKVCISQMTFEIVMSILYDNKYNKYLFQIICGNNILYLMAINSYVEIKGVYVVWAYGFVCNFFHWEKYLWNVDGGILIRNSRDHN